MATAQELLLLRDYVSEPDDVNGWTDERLERYADAASNLHKAAADVWGVKAGTYAGLVNVSESGSSRSLSGLLDQAQKMEKYHRGLGDEEDGELLNSGPVIRTIRRAR